MRLLLALLLLTASTISSAETYLQINGTSLHSKPGFNAANYGAGIEHDLDNTWSVAAGWYRNSEYNGSTYGYTRYAIWKSGDWNVGIGAGIVTGYNAHKVLPMAFPEVCYSYLCGLFLPQVESTGASVLGLHLKIPVN